VSGHPVQDETVSTLPASHCPWFPFKLGIIVLVFWMLEANYEYLTFLHSENSFAPFFLSAFLISYLYLIH